MTFPRRTQRAFNLVEIAITMGIISVALVSILGLLGVFFNVGKSATDETLLASMSRRFVEEMRTKPFADVSSSAGSLFYFDIEGNPLGNSTGAWYECEVAPAPNIDPDLDSTLFRFTLIFRWPIGTASDQSFRFHSSVAKYE